MFRIISELCAQRIFLLRRQWPFADCVLRSDRPQDSIPSRSTGIARRSVTTPCRRYRHCGPARTLAPGPARPGPAGGCTPWNTYTQGRRLAEVIRQEVKAGAEIDRRSIWRSVLETPTTLPGPRSCGSWSRAGYRLCSRRSWPHLPRRAPRPNPSVGSRSSSPRSPVRVERQRPGSRPCRL